MDLNKLDLKIVVDRCREENTKFVRSGSSDSEYCFEVFRRALFEMQSEALTQVRFIYDLYLLKWVKNHPQISFVDEIPEYFCEVAFENFYFNLCGQKFLQFASLSRVLAYLRSCVYTAVTGYARSTRHVNTDLNEDSDIQVSTNLQEEVETEELWQHISNLLGSGDDFTLTYSVFVLDMKPHEIVQQYSHIWDHERLVSVRLQHIKRVLRRDKTLRGWLGFDETSE